ncbi:MAG: hypothetical protein PHU64_03435 [Candidatus Omnitrophica bacterium]|nr:hypothetical protein [Candidatus Omnitrophota bacterium]MDD5430019.1 hypothetical protein [Candidatus Omnitrophota bacterium]
MFDFSKLGDLSKVAGQAKEMQAKQEASLREQTNLLRKISSQLDDIAALLKKKA